MSNSGGGSASPALKRQCVGSGSGSRTIGSGSVNFVRSSESAGCLCEYEFSGNSTSEGCRVALVVDEDTARTEVVMEKPGDLRTEDAKAMVQSQVAELRHKAQLEYWSRSYDTALQETLSKIHDPVERIREEMRLKAAKSPFIVKCLVDLVNGKGPFSASK
jgi:hypothetical protein